MRGEQQQQRGHHIITVWVGAVSGYRYNIQVVGLGERKGRHSYHVDDGSQTHSLGDSLAQTRGQESWSLTCSAVSHRAQQWDMTDDQSIASIPSPRAEETRILTFYYSSLFVPVLYPYAQKATFVRMDTSPMYGHYICPPRVWGPQMSTSE